MSVGIADPICEKFWEFPSLQTEADLSATATALKKMGCRVTPVNDGRWIGANGHR
jgi:hypothetical protein